MTTSINTKEDDECVKQLKENLATLERMRRTGCTRKAYLPIIHPELLPPLNARERVKRRYQHFVHPSKIRLVEG